MRGENNISIAGRLRDMSKLKGPVDDNVTTSENKPDSAGINLEGSHHIKQKEQGKFNFIYLLKFSIYFKIKSSHWLSIQNSKVLPEVLET